MHIKPVSEEPHLFELSPEELQNIPKTIDKMLGLIKWASEIGNSTEEYRRKLKKALKLKQEKEFDNQFL